MLSRWLSSAGTKSNSLSAKLGETTPVLGPPLHTSKHGLTGSKARANASSDIPSPPSNRRAVSPSHSALQMR